MSPSIPLAVTTTLTRPAHAHAAWGAVRVGAVERVPGDAYRCARVLRAESFAAERILPTGDQLKVCRIHAMAHAAYMVDRERCRNGLAMMELVGESVRRLDDTLRVEPPHVERPIAARPGTAPQPTRRRTGAIVHLAPKPLEHGHHHAASIRAMACSFCIHSEELPWRLS